MGIRPSTFKSGASAVSPRPLCGRLVEFKNDAEDQETGSEHHPYAHSQAQAEVVHRGCDALFERNEIGLQGCDVPLFGEILDDQLIAKTGGFEAASVGQGVEGHNAANVVNPAVYTTLGALLISYSALTPANAAQVLVLGQPFLRVAAEAADHRLQLGDCGGDPLPVGAAHHQRDAEIAAPEIGVRADFEIAVALLQCSQILRDRAL